jgi:hypothetical protein|tara:strand:- start:521 stop:1363 length:843 start_codon:yes stop_codon:yes gene_type:complete
MSQLKLVKLDEPGNSGDAYGLPDVQTSGRIRIPDEFKKKKWEKGGERKKHKKQLGQKVGYTLHHWRLKQKETHDNLIGRATSSVGKEVERHRKLYQYNQKISKLSEKNKAAARKFAQKHADRNMLIEKQRLANVQAHFSFAEYEHDYREHAHKMQTQATVDDQWMPFSQRLAASKFMTPSEKRKKAQRNKLMRASGQRPRRKGKGKRPSTAGPSTRRSSRNNTPRTRVIGLDEFLEEGMSSVMPSPMRATKRGNNGRSVVLLTAMPKEGVGSPSRLSSTM